METIRITNMESLRRDISKKNQELEQIRAEFLQILGENEQLLTKNKQILDDREHFSEKIMNQLVKLSEITKENQSVCRDIKFYSPIIRSKLENITTELQKINATHKSYLSYIERNYVEISNIEKAQLIHNIVEDAKKSTEKVIPSTKHLCKRYCLNERTYYNLKKSFVKCKNSE